MIIKNRKNILIISGVFYPEPVVSANLLTQLAEELSKRYEVTVLRPVPSRPKGFKMPNYDYSQLPYKVIEINSYACPESSLRGRFKESISMGKECCRYIDEHKDTLDLIYNAGWHLFSRKMVANKCVKYNIPYMTPVQDIYPESLISKLPNIGSLKWAMMKFLMPYDIYTLSHAGKIHTISEKMVEILSSTRGLSKEKFVVVRNWQNEEDFIKYQDSYHEELDNDQFTFMYLGNVGPLAGIEVLFESLKLSNLTDVRLVIAGSGSAKENLQKLAQTEYRDCKIEFWEVPSGEVPATQAKADVMCLPVKKGFALSSIPSKLPAYMFSAKPILASVDEESDTAICVKNSNSGWVAKPEDVADIAHWMREAYTTSKEKRKEMGQNGFDFALENISKKNNLPKLV